MFDKPTVLKNILFPAIITKKNRTKSGKKKSRLLAGISQGSKLLLDVDNNAFPTVRPLPRKLRFRGYPLNLNAQGGKAALPPRVCPSDKTLVRALRRRPIVVAKSAELRFRLTAKTAPAPLLLLSQSGPLRWARFGSPSWGPEGGCTIPWQKEIPAKRRGFLKGVNYSSMSITTPEPTVRPPSRMAKRRPFSMAMGVISSTFMSTLSPGMHISVPSGRVMMPVTSVVRK